MVPAGAPPVVVTALDGQDAERPTEIRQPQDLAPTSPGGDPGSSTTTLTCSPKLHSPSSRWHRPSCGHWVRSKDGETAGLGLESSLWLPLASRRLSRFSCLLVWVLFCVDLPSSCQRALPALWTLQGVTLRAAARDLLCPTDSSEDISRADLTAGSPERTSGPGRWLSG